MKSSHDISHQEKIQITAVSYLNTKPLLYGLFKSELANKIDLQLNIPSICAQKLKEGKVDLGLVPVAIIPELNNPQIISDFCIGAVGAVKTVCIYGDCPIEEMTHIHLDYHSRTSVALTKILLKKFWKANPELINAKPGYETQIGNSVGGLIIGDRTMGLESKYAYEYDLGAAWTEMTGLPFVFAVWVATKPIPTQFINQFNLALQRGIEEIPQLTYLVPSPSPAFDLKTYYTKYISYDLDQGKRKALDLFLGELQEYSKTENASKLELVFH